MPYIGNLNPTVPAGSDPISQGDDEFRALKRTLLDSFPGLSNQPWQKEPATRDDQAPNWGQVRDLFPVGSVQFTATNVSPGTYLKGTWKQIAQGRFLVGVGTGSDAFESRAYGSGNSVTGSYRHRLTGDENGPHVHQILPGGSLAEINNSTGGGNTQGGFAGGQNLASATNVQSSGAGLPHENSPPGFGLYVWQRTA